MKQMFGIVIAAFLFLMLGSGPLSAGYTIDPWGGKRWEGPGRPPHWSPASEHSPPVQPKSERPGGYWQDRHDRWHYHRYRQPGYIYYQAPAPEPVTIEREKEAPVYVVPPPPLSRQQCGGETLTRVDDQTGELIIEYVTGSRDCP